MPTDSTKPLGSTSYKETAFGIIPHSQLLLLELEGTKKGLEYIYDLYRADAVIEISPSLILDLHAVSFQWIFPDWAGKFRTIQVTYSEKEAPPYFKVPELIKNVCDDLQVRLASLPDPATPEFIDSTVSLLAWFQHQITLIHPFQDYNGRTARMLTSLIVLKLKLPAIEIQVETEADRKNYLKAMQTADEGNLLPLEKLISAALTESLLD